MSELPGFGSSLYVEGGLPTVADRMASFIQEASPSEKPTVLGNGYGAFIALQMVIRHPYIAKKLILANCGAKFLEPGREAFKNMVSISKAKGLEAIAAVRCGAFLLPHFRRQIRN